MDENKFWQIIDDSREISKEDDNLFIKNIKNELLTLAESDIIDFEYILRQKIIEADHYKIQATQKIILGYLSDDSFLYFRCWLIGQNKKIYNQTLKNPDILADYYEKDYFSNEKGKLEELSYVSTYLFEEKTGREEDESFPISICVEKGLDYDFFAGETRKGDKWNKDDLPELYPKLYKKFKRI